MQHLPSDPFIIELMLIVISFLIATLVGLIGWFSVRILNKLDFFGETISAVKEELAEDINGIHTRVTVLENRVGNPRRR